MLLMKRGEITALQRMAPHIKNGITPWLRVLPPELRSTRDSDPPFQAMSRLAADLAGQSVYLDAAAVRRRARRATSLDAPYVDAIYEAAGDAGLSFSPVYPMGRQDLADVVSMTARTVGLGAAIHVDAQSLVAWDGKRPADVLRADLELLEVPAGEIDLMVDLGYLASPPDEISLRWLLSEFAGIAAWRSLIVAGTSVPDSVASDVERDALGVIPRREAMLAERAAAAAGRAVRFADHGVQHPVPPTPGPVPMMVPSIRYTAGGSLLVARARSAVKGRSLEDKRGDYQQLADRLVRHPSFRRDCCWGDRYLEAVALGAMRPASQETMRAIATCHHIAEVALGYVGTDVSARPPAEFSGTSSPTVTA
jgi:hypothetical protein